MLFIKASAIIHKIIGAIHWKNKIKIVNSSDCFFTKKA
jgi:hypothetical protein